MSTRFLHLLALLALPPFAMAQPALPDPVPPAVIGRPVDEPAPPRPTASKPAAPKASAQAREPAPKRAVDDRVDPRTRSDDVGKGTRLARKPLAPGAYIGEKHRTAALNALKAVRPSGKPVKWQIGEPVPRGAKLAAVPDAVLSQLPKLPPGHRYVLLGGDVLLIGAESRMVVDAVSRNAR